MLSTTKYNWMYSQPDCINETKIQQGSGKACSSKQPDVFTGFILYALHGFFYISFYENCSRLYFFQCSRKYIFSKFRKTRPCRFSHSQAELVGFSADKQTVNTFEKIGHSIVLIGEAPIVFTIWTFDVAIQTDGYS